MEKNSSTSNFKSWPWAFVVAVIAIVIIECLVVRFDDHFYYPPFNNLRMKVKNEISQTDELKHDVVVLGDSYNLTSLDPKLLTKNTGLTAFNYSTFAVNSVITSYVLLRNELRKEGPKPRYLILGYLDYIPQMSKEYIRDNFAHTLFDFKKGNVDVFTKEFGLTMGLKFLIPTLKHQGYFILNAKPTPLDKIHSVKNSVFEKDGFYEWHTERVFDGNIDYINTDDEFYVTPYFEKYMRKILNLAEQHNMTVLYIMPTVVPELDQRLSAAGRRAAYMQYLQSLTQDFSEMEIMYPALVLSDADLYTDQDHLNHKGSKILCQMVSEWLSAHSRSP